MNSVSMIILPTNGRLTFDPEGSEETLGQFTTLPIVMPRNVTAWTDSDGRPMALWCDDQRIRPADFATVLTGVEQYNDDVAGRGTEPGSPAAVTEAIVREEWDDGDED
jgi:hypothetical protein